MVSIAAMTAAFTACNDSGNSWLPKTGIEPLPVNNDMSAFFKENLHLIASSVFDRYNEHGWKVPVYTDSCVTINSADEYMDIECAPAELPTIDFDTCTLVIGQYMAVHGGIHIVSQNIVAEPEKITMNISLGVYDGGHYCVVVVSSFRALCPKLTSRPVSMNVVY